MAACRVSFCLLVSLPPLADSNIFRGRFVKNAVTLLKRLEGRLGIHRISLLSPPRAHFAPRAHLLTKMDMPIDDAGVLQDDRRQEEAAVREDE